MAINFRINILDAECKNSPSPVFALFVADLLEPAGLSETNIKLRFYK